MTSQGVSLESQNPKNIPLFSEMLEGLIASRRAGPKLIGLRRADVEWLMGA
jgi:hypothetical protein